MTASLEQKFQQLKPFEGVVAWYLLGSGARDQLRPDSDLDLAAMPYPGVLLDRWDLIQWATDASLVFERTVDVGICDSPFLVYAKEAIYTGRRIYCKDETVTRKRESELLALYLTYLDDRKEVIHAYRA